MATSRPKVLLSWSSGKDSAWVLHILRQQSDLEVAVRRELVEAQAAAGLPLFPVMLPFPVRTRSTRTG